jgi:hypothetical protein
VADPVLPPVTHPRGQFLQEACMVSLANILAEQTLQAEAPSSFIYDPGMQERLEDAQKKKRKKSQRNEK